MRIPFVVSLLSLLLSMPALSSELTVTVTLNGQNTPVKDAVVYLDEPGAVTPVTTEIYQKDRQFHPHILVIPVGSQVAFPNRDNTQHHVYSFSPAKTFDIELYAGTPQAPVLFDKPGVVELGCNIHDHMQAFIVVTDTDIVGRTNANGQVVLPLGPDDGVDGSITLNIWHPRLPDNTKPITQTINMSDPGDISITLMPEPANDTSMDLLQQRFRNL
jgi:plastocyanin